MRKVLLGLFVATSLASSVACADVIGLWTKDTGVSGYDRWTLKVTPNAGETMAGFDIAVFDSDYSAVLANDGTPFSTSVNGLTHFLLQTSHGFPVVTDLNTVAPSVGPVALSSSLSAVSGGLYASGWSSALNLLQVVVPTGTYGAVGPNGQPAGLSIVDSSGSGAPLWGNFGGALSEVKFVPEPGTLALLATGLVGLLAYAWRKRK